MQSSCLTCTYALAGVSSSALGDCEVKSCLCAGR